MGWGQRKFILDEVKFADLNIEVHAKSAISSEAPAMLEGGTFFAG